MDIGVHWKFTICVDDAFGTTLSLLTPSLGMILADTIMVIGHDPFWDHHDHWILDMVFADTIMVIGQDLCWHYHFTWYLLTPYLDLIYVLFCLHLDLPLVCYILLKLSTFNIPYKQASVVVEPEFWWILWYRLMIMFSICGMNNELSKCVWACLCGCMGVCFV